MREPLDLGPRRPFGLLGGYCGCFFGRELGG